MAEMRTVNYNLAREVPLPRHLVWSMLSDTDHLNRVIGLFPVKFGQAVDNRLGLFREATAKVMGLIPLSWNEYPFEWVQQETYSVVREYRSGPLKRFRGGISLRDSETLLPDGSPATLLCLFAEFTPSHWIGRLSIPFIGKTSMHNTFNYMSSCSALNRESDKFIRPQPSRISETDMRVLDRSLDDLANQAVNPALLPLLRQHVISNSDDEVVDMRPYQIADQWQVAREDVLRLFLYATKVGITNLSWHLICPNCRVSQTSLDHMNSIQAQFHCDFCGVDYEASFDRHVELCFAIHPQIRKAVKQTYCIGGPGLSPHILTQAYVKQSSSVSMRIPDTDIPLRLRVLRYNAIASIRRIADEQYLTKELAYSKAGLTVKEIVVRDKPAFTVHNNSEQDVVIVIERAEWDDIAVTAAKVTAMHEFRGMFSSEVLAPGQQVGIENVTLFFSDLLGSTSFYERVGDAQAYGQVRRHFDYMLRYIDLYQGALVKTIGDAVMAVFEYPENALKAAIDIQAHVHEFNQDLPDNEKIVIKIGLHHGPAIAVNSNNRLDYFGRTVNIAARIQGLSSGHDVILSEEMMNVSALRKVLEQRSVSTQSLYVNLKGIEEKIRLTRIQLS